MSLTRIDFDPDEGGGSIEQCNDCGAHAEVGQSIRHHATCYSITGEGRSAEEWERYYADDGEGSDDA